MIAVSSEAGSSRSARGSPPGTGWPSGVSVRTSKNSVEPARCRRMVRGQPAAAPDGGWISLAADEVARLDAPIARCEVVRERGSVVTTDQTARPAAALVAGLVVRTAPLLLVACTLVEPTPIVAPSDIVAPSGLAATMDPGEGAIILDDARRHSPPSEALQRRVYSVVPSFVRWTWQPDLSFPADRVALVGSPPPLPGQRFVLFDEGGPFSVVEATGERCPPGHEDCVVCDMEDPARRHWARYVGPQPVSPPRWASALGPFAAGEPLPAPRRVNGAWQSRGFWSLGAEDDLDGDGTVDRVRALRDCRPERPNHPRCKSQAETWRLHTGHWFAEPRATSLPSPMHMLGLSMVQVFPNARSAWVNPWFGGEVPPGDYAIVARWGVVGTIRHEVGTPAWCLVDGEECKDLDPLVHTKRRIPAWAHAVGPVPAGVRLRVRKTFDEPTTYPGVGAPRVVIERDDGRRWTYTVFSCMEVSGERVESRHCHEVRQDGGGPAIRWLMISGSMGNQPVCARLAEPPPIAAE